MTSEPRFSLAPDPKPPGHSGPCIASSTPQNSKTCPRCQHELARRSVVSCIVLTDRHGDTHAFKFDRTPTRFGAVVASFSTITAQVHVWSKTMPFDKGEVLTVATSALEDPGAARLDKRKLTWGEFWVETGRALHTTNSRETKP